LQKQLRDDRDASPRRQAIKLNARLFSRKSGEAANKVVLSFILFRDICVRARDDQEHISYTQIEDETQDTEDACLDAKSPAKPPTRSPGSFPESSGFGWLAPSPILDTSKPVDEDTECDDEYLSAKQLRKRRKKNVYDPNETSTDELKMRKGWLEKSGAPPNFFDDAYEAQRKKKETFHRIRF